MYCHHCERTFAEDAIYCSQCGRKLLQHNITVIHTVGIWPESEQQGVRELTIQEEFSEKKSKKVKTRLKINDFGTKAVIGIVLLLVIIFSVLFFTYKQESAINEQVLSLQSLAKVEALEGNYDKALQLLEEAILLRPKFNSLSADEAIVHHAIRIERISNDLEATIEQGKELDAEQQLEELRQELKGFKEPIFEKHRQRLEELNMKYSVLSLTNELARIGTIDDLGNLLNVVNGLIGEEASTLKKQITDRIRTTTTAEVNTLLDRKRYTAAITTVDEALSWVRGDDVLLELKQRIKKEQTAYAIAEEQRIQRAMEEAAAEDYINQTAAIELIEFEKGMNELGDIVLVAYLKNVATRAIYDITIQYEVLNANDQVITEGSSKVTPNYVASGEGMSFSITLSDQSDFEQEVSLKIKDGSWSLE